PAILNPIVSSPAPSDLPEVAPVRRLRMTGEDTNAIVVWYLWPGRAGNDRHRDHWGAAVRAEAPRGGPIPRQGHHRVQEGHEGLGGRGGRRRQHAQSPGADH